MHSAAILVLAVLGAAGGGLNAQGRELVLNYQDPHGTALILAIVPHASDVPKWIRDAAFAESGSQLSKFALSPSESGNSGQKLPRYVMELPENSTMKDAQKAPAEIGAQTGPRVEIQPATGSLRSVRECGDNARGDTQCKVSNLANDVLTAALQNSGQTASFTDLLASKNLVMDERAAKRVLVSVDDNDAFQHTDFVGLVRGRNEKLPAPDAVSAFVIRMDANGTFSVIERRAEAIDPSSIKFEFEKNP
jgi:hypothetical protein